MKKRLFIILLLVLVVLPSFGQGDPGNSGFMQLKITGDMKPLSNYPCVFTQYYCPDQESSPKRTVIKGKLDEFGCWLIPSGVRNDLPFQVEVGSEDDLHLLYFKTRCLVVPMNPPATSFEINFLSVQPQVRTGVVDHVVGCTAFFEGDNLDLNNFAVLDKNKNRIKVDRNVNTLLFYLPELRTNMSPVDYTFHIVSKDSTGVWQTLRNWKFRLVPGVSAAPKITIKVSPKAKKSNE
ncbi:MAG: hypothetical protein HQM10_25150 [Candidatus Riflebacteria bacterium]|nr:hypothetical protein [Candidatus Riflebacteria bacterium]